MLDARNVLDAGLWQAEGWTLRGLGRNAGLASASLAL
jgi:UDPglucose 6-dehydrogenase